MPTTRAITMAGIGTMLVRRGAANTALIATKADSSKPGTARRPFAQLRVVQVSGALNGRIGR
ncbi:MAG: hypothetical protein ACXU9D_16370 [Xanthobacteraceae bacterium]